jgi:hypothetical protein
MEPFKMQVPALPNYACVGFTYDSYVERSANFTLQKTSTLENRTISWVIKCGL